jgi:hypothetical protein
VSKLAEEFLQIPFNHSASPEQAEEIFRLSHVNLMPLKDKDEAVQKVISEIEKWRPAKKNRN